jgi:hypothetical protein
VKVSPLLASPPTRFALWRTQSTACAAIDGAVLVLGVALVLIPTLDSILSWPTDTVLLSATDLERLAGFLLIPAWIWMLGSAALIGGSRKRQHAGTKSWFRSGTRAVNKPIVIVLVGTALAVLIVVVVSFVIGGDKGSLRILPGGVHQVSTLGVNSAIWTTISVRQYRMWDARFVREDAVFAFFGLAMIWFSVVMLRLRANVERGGRN